MSFAKVVEEQWFKYHLDDIKMRPRFLVDFLFEEEFSIADCLTLAAASFVPCSTGGIEGLLIKGDIGRIMQRRCHYLRDDVARGCFAIDILV